MDKDMENKKNLRILVTDDDADVQDLLSTYLSAQGMEITTADNGVNALKKLKEKEFDLVISDVMMPEMGGIELLKRTTKEYPEIATLMLTSMDETQIATQAMQLGAYDYILKPVDFGQLNLCIQNALSKQGLIRENRAYKQQLEKMVREQGDVINQQRSQLMHADKLSSIGMLISGICHEINNPLSFIKSNIELLGLYFGNLAKTLEEYATEHPGYKLKNMNMGEVVKNINGMLEDSSHGVQKITAIVDDIMGFSRKKSEEKRPFSMKECVESSLNLARFITKNKVKVITEFDPDAPLVLGQPQKIEQVLLNLFQNAVYAMRGRAGAELNIAVRRTTGKKDAEKQVAVEVRDNGPGMPEEVRLHIFEPYYTTKPSGEGTGLGLFISKDIIEGHGGTIEVASGTGGTVFVITLPAAKKENAAS